MQDSPSSGPDPVAPRVRVTVVMFEDREAEPKNPIQTPPTSPRRGWNRSQHVMYAGDKQVIFVAKMRVKRGSADIRAIEDLLHDDGVVGLFSDQRNQSPS